MPEASRIFARLTVKGQAVMGQHLISPRIIGATLDWKLPTDFREEGAVSGKSQLQIWLKKQSWLPPPFPTFPLRVSRTAS